MFFAAILGITVVPVLMLLLVRGKITSEAKNPINRFLIWTYQPFVNFVKLRLSDSADDLSRRWSSWSATYFSLLDTRQRIHAAAERRDNPLHANRSARYVDHRGDENPANPGPNAGESARSGACIWQSGPV